jgi:uncharacterized phosphosugar-binding protein
MIAQTYHTRLLEIIQFVNETQKPRMEAVAKRMAETLMQGGLVHLFGSGHSHLPVEEAFFRSGGLAPMNPIFDPSLMLHEGIQKIIRLERLEGYAKIVLDNYDVRKGEVMLIFSVSGKNPAPVDMALMAQEKGLYTVGITSLDYANNSPALHSCGKHLHEVADTVIDLGVPFGDALVVDDRLPGLKSAGAGATIISLYIVNMLQMLVVDLYLQAGLEPPLTICFNTGEAAASAQNATTYASIQSRMRHL